MTALTPKPAVASQGMLYRLTRNKVGVAGFVIVGFIVFIAVFGPMFVGKISQDAQNTWAGPSAEHWLGTDYAGKDVFDQLLSGGGTVVYVGFLAAAISTTIAVVLGALAAYLRGRVDRILLQATDIVMTVPQIVLLAVLGAFFQLSSPTVVAILIGTLSWPILMRSIRAQVLTLKEREFVEAAKLLDLGTARIVFSEIVPNMAGFVLINFIIAVTDAVYALVGLYVLGLAPLSGANWGIMINKAWVFDAFSLTEGVMFMMGPVALIALLQLGLIMLTRSLEEVFNPRLSEG
ncbi:ABC transporter permease [Stackebrandtia nassauensis]|uniref:Binding-protein-dependent transport systems inner membrane component n=1 Tax=Stackebrandtia nassauensis (strain DSM 44728 / CIP 108903 / NRRL B-16338 / NBRC 102104 / LLR-40K-21) TaxID=446470 RepID=D3QB31_STANL|nr:ABC transporter permease subunit [Stackebrandtia nassauensis]ADD40848.1 binding-protein-dependent transport systems inner membrane component [Stackebrandtia nassauensis DSM 44728]